MGFRTLSEERFRQRTRPSRGPPTPPRLEQRQHAVAQVSQPPHLTTVDGLCYVN